MLTHAICPSFHRTAAEGAPRHCQLRTLRKDFASAMLEDLRAKSGRLPGAQGHYPGFDQTVQTGVFQVAKKTVGLSKDMMWVGENHGPAQMLIMFSNKHPNSWRHGALHGCASHLKKWRTSHMCIVCTDNVYNRLFLRDWIVGTATDCSIFVF